jgi:choice-of-anchor A domain-containing protein
VNGQTQQSTSVALPFSFAQTESDLRNLSTRLKTLQANGTTVAQYGGITLTGAVAGRNVFDVPVASLNSCNSFTVNVPSGATVLINVTGSGPPALQNFGITLNGN